VHWVHGATGAVLIYDVILYDRMLYDNILSYDRMLYDNIRDKRLYIFICILGGLAHDQRLGAAGDRPAHITIYIYFTIYITIYMYYIRWARS
jgi:hypothetical protein